MNRMERSLSLMVIYEGFRFGLDQVNPGSTS
jgi:hypothetical protein